MKTQAVAFGATEVRLETFMPKNLLNFLDENTHCMDKDKAVGDCYPGFKKLFSLASHFLIYRNPPYFGVRVSARH